MYDHTPSIDFGRLFILLFIDTIIAAAIAYKQHKEYGYSFGKQFAQIWIGITGLSFIIMKFF
ncbi:MAG: hypothetical protein KAH10_04200 [Flavobacteriales bacterium]|nr:hypothetical protein [Flavobacteriales bacterium]